LAGLGRRKRGLDVLQTDRPRCGDWSGVRDLRDSEEDRAGSDAQRGRRSGCVGLPGSVPGFFIAPSRLPAHYYELLF